ncbi:hypothetical protein DTL42_09370 [Bremerella cremea]|uniref:Uncharacterized protein n=1 Tax=Bremerella cremea TaxID=1031537 RepID=A0A368KVU9_9BACT|nr:hypothetical protein [Bremerella cremea]RCS53012.1 hypothetical protein DTL42_09370 [Bremerella cremea]
MKYSLTGTGSDGKPVSQVVDFPDEAAVRAYADWKGFAVTKITLLPDQTTEIPLDNQPRPPTTECDRLKANATICYFCASAFLIAGILSVPLPVIFPVLLISTALFLFSIGASYRIGARVRTAITEQSHH